MPDVSYRSGIRIGPESTEVNFPNIEFKQSTVLVDVNRNAYRCPIRVHVIRFCDAHSASWSFAFSRQKLNATHAPIIKVSNSDIG